jgi:uncharacterized membrane protein
MGAMLSLIAAACFFVGIHLLVAGTRLRDRLVARLGERRYLGGFSLASLVGMVWLSLAYSAAFASSANAGYWTTPTWLRDVVAVVVLIALTLVVYGLTSKNPTAAQQERLLETDTELATGILRITRHPFLWGVALWASAHLAANGDRASLVLFGAMLVNAVAGTFSIDHKRARLFGARWQAFARQTSNIPFAAIARGDNRLVVRELVNWRAAVTIVAYVALVTSHPWLYDARPLPWWPL